MDSLYLLIPFSVLLVLALIGVFAWALDGGQFEDLEREGLRILADGASSVDADQAAAEAAPEQS